MEYGKGFAEFMSLLKGGISGNGCQVECLVLGDWVSGENNSTSTLYDHWKVSGKGY